VNGNVCIPKPALVAALSRYFGETGVGSGQFIEQAYVSTTTPEHPPQNSGTRARVGTLNPDLRPHKTTEGGVR